MYTRRDFFKISSLLAISATIPGSHTYGYDSVDESKYFFDTISGGNELRSRGYLYKFVILNLNTHEIKEIPLNIRPHTVIPGIKKGEAYLVEKNDTSIAKINYHTGKLLKTFKYEYGANYFFKGHGSINPQDGFLYTSEVHNTHKMDSLHMKGVIRIRNPDTFEVIGEFFSFGNDPHDFVIQEGKLIICNSSLFDPSWAESATYMNATCRNVAVIDLATKQLLKQIAMPINSISPGHIKIAPNGFVVGGTIGTVHDQVIKGPKDDLHRHLAVTESRPVFISNDYEATLLPLFEGPRQQFISEFLSVAVNPKNNLIGMTNPSMNAVLFWNLNDLSFNSEIKLQKPKTISNYKDDSFIINGLKETTIVSVEDFSIRSLRMFPNNSNLNMAHSYVLG